MAETMTAIEAAAHALGAEIGEQPWRVAVGLRRGHGVAPALVVYATNVRAAKRVVPETFDGFPVTVRRSSRLRPALDAEPPSGRGRRVGVDGRR